MAEKKTFNLKVITPGGVKLDELAEMVIMRATTGDIGILAGHRPLGAALVPGDLRITLKGGVERLLEISGGLAKVDERSLSVHCGFAQWREAEDN